MVRAIVELQKSDGCMNQLWGQEAIANNIFLHLTKLILPMHNLTDFFLTKCIFQDSMNL